MHELDVSEGLRIVGSRRCGAVAEFTVEISRSCPFFEGHFPGHPVFPGVAQLLLVVLLQRRISGVPTAVAEVPFLRFYQMLSPGETVAVALVTESTEPSTSFEMRRADSLVSRGTVRWLERSTE